LPESEPGARRPSEAATEFSEMRKFLIGLAAVIVILVVVALVLPFLIPVEAYRDQLVKAVKEQTGRDLVIAGDMGLTILPSVSISAEEVSFSNAEWAEKDQMATIGSLLVKVDLLPLLGGELVIDSFKLVDPVINLEVNKQGTPNWQFAEPEESTAETTDTGGGGFSLRELRLGEVGIENGTVSYRDGTTGETQTLSNINLGIELTGLDRPLVIDGALDWRGETVNLDLRADAVRPLMEGGETPLSASVKAAPVTFEFDGRATKAEALSFAGSIDLDIPSIPALAEWTGNPIEGLKPDQGKFNIGGDVAVNGPSIRFTNAKLSFDEIAGTGELSVNTGGAKPKLAGRLDLGALNLNPYMPEPSGEPAAQGPSGWSEEPIDMSGLKSVDADFNLTVESLQVREIKVGQSALHAVLQNGVLTVDLEKLDLYDGSGTGRLVADASGSTPRIASRFDLSSILIRPLLTDAAGFEDLEGTGTVRFDVTSTGASQKQLVQNLNGNGGINLVDGAVYGVNLGAMARNVESAFLNAAAGEAQKTDFAELNGTFQIAKGVLTNDDLTLINPFLRVLGAGKSELVPRTVDYRLEPKLVGTQKGQGSEQEKSGVTVPIVITGTWDNLSYSPDLAGIGKQMLQDPGKLEDAAKGVLGGSQSESTDGTTEEGGSDSLEDKVKEGIGGFFKKKD
jgi:AsmA protein